VLCLNRDEARREDQLVFVGNDVHADTGAQRGHAPLEPRYTPA